MNEEVGTSAQLEDSGCVQDAAQTLQDSVQRIYLLDLSDDVLLNILKYCQARDLKALGFTCPRLAYLICDYTLWYHVDATSQPCSADRLKWYMSMFNPGTKHLLINGYAREAKLQEEAYRQRARNAEPSTSKDPRASTQKRAHDGKLKTIDASNYGSGNVAPSNYTESPSSPSYPVRLPATYCVQGTSSLQLPRMSSSPLPSPAEGMYAMTITRSILSRLSEQCPNLTWLALDYCNIDCHKTKLSMFPSTLKKLSLLGSRCYNLPLDKSFLYRIHEFLPHLEDMDVSFCNWLLPSSLLPLSRLPMLTTLRARYCNMLSEFVAYASLATRYGFMRLRVLDVRNSPLADSEVSSLGWLPCLEELYLGATDDIAGSPYEPNKAILDEWELNEPEYFKQRNPTGPPADSPPPSDTEPSNRRLHYELFDSLDQERCNVSVFTITVNHNRPQPIANVLALLGETERAENNARQERRRAAETRRRNDVIDNVLRSSCDRIAENVLAAHHVDEAAMASKLRLMRENVERMGESLKRMGQTIDTMEMEQQQNHDNNDENEERLKDKEKLDSASEELNKDNENSDTNSKEDSGVDDTSEQVIGNDSRHNKNEQKDVKDQNTRKRPNYDEIEATIVKKSKNDENVKNSQLVVNIAGYLQNDEPTSTCNIDIKIKGNNGSSSAKKSKASTSQSVHSSSYSEASTSSSNSEPSTFSIEASASRSEASTSHSVPNSSYSEASTSQSVPSSSHSEASTSSSNSEPSTSSSEASASRSEASTSHSVPNSSYSEASTSQSVHSSSYSEASTSQSVPSSSHSEASTSSSEASTSKQSDNTKPGTTKYVKFRKNRPPIVLDQPEEPRPEPRNRPPYYLEGDFNRMLDEVNENIVQDGFPLICVDLGRPTPRTYQVTVSNERSNNENPPGPRPARMLNMIRNIFYAPPPVIGPSSLITDMAIRHFGRECNRDIIHIGPNGAIIRGGPEGHRGRPKKSKLRKLVCTGYNGITNSSLSHLAEAAPDLIFIDFSGTRVDESGVNSFKAIRPDCEVVYTEKSKEKKDESDV